MIEVHRRQEDRYVGLVAERGGRRDHGQGLGEARLDLLGGVGLDGGEHEVEPVGAQQRGVLHDELGVAQIERLARRATTSGRRRR